MATEWLLKFHPLVFCKWGTVLCNISSSCQAPGRSHDIEYGHGRTCVHARFQSQLSISALCGKPKSPYCHFTISANATDKCTMSWVEPIILHMFFLSTLALFLKVSIPGQHYGTKSLLEIRQSSWDKFHNPVQNCTDFFLKLHVGKWE